MKRLDHWTSGAILFALVGCATNPASGDAEASGQPAPLTADVRDAGGRTLARATLTPTGSAILVRVDAAGLQPGSYAAHIHTIGRCDPPAFTSAGPHWNPTARQHGKDNPAGMHKGDLPNLLVGADGRGSFEFTVSGVRPSGAAGSLLDEDGAAVVVHASPDDYRTDPAGNAGNRIACGVIGA